jgi:DNA mismatch repair protein MSH3
VLHERFVKKLGRPESIAEIKRRQNIATAEHAEAEEGEDEDEDDDPSAKSNKGRKSSATAKKKLTPMLQQIVDIKRAHMDTLLVIEVGYKCYFYGEDARIASKELGIVCSSGKYRFDNGVYQSLHASDAYLLTRLQIRPRHTLTDSHER